MVSMFRCLPSYLAIGFALAALAAAPIQAETYKLSVKQAVERALAQNPDVVLARLDEESGWLATRSFRAWM